MNHQVTEQITKEQSKQLETSLSKAGVVKSTKNGVEQFTMSLADIVTLCKELAPVKTSPTRIIRVPEVCNRIATSRTHLHRLIAAQKFPAPVKLSEKLIGFYEHEVEEYLNALSIKGSK